VIPAEKESGQLHRL